MFWGNFPVNLSNSRLGTDKYLLKTQLHFFLASPNYKPFWKHYKVRREKITGAVACWIPIYFTKSLSHAVALVAARCISCSKVHGFFKVPQTLSKLTVWNVVSMGVAGGRAEAAARGCISCSGSETTEFLETDFTRASLGFSHVIAMSYIRLIDLFPKILG